MMSGQQDIIGDVDEQHNPEDVWLNPVFPFEDWTLETHSPTMDRMVRKTIELAPRLQSILNGAHPGYCNPYTNCGSQGGMRR